jgi:hypothetical protein
MTILLATGHQRRADDRTIASQDESPMKAG